MKKNDFYYSTWLFYTFVIWSVVISMIMMWTDVDNTFVSIALKSIASIALVLLLVYVTESINHSDRVSKELEQAKIENEKFLKELKESIEDFY